MSSSDSSTLALCNAVEAGLVDQRKALTVLLQFVQLREVGALLRPMGGVDPLGAAQALIAHVRSRATDLAAVVFGRVGWSGDALDRAAGELLRAYSQHRGKRPWTLTLLSDLQFPTSADALARQLEEVLEGWAVPNVRSSPVGENPRHADEPSAGSGQRPHPTTGSVHDEPLHQGKSLANKGFVHEPATSEELASLMEGRPERLGEVRLDSGEFAKALNCTRQNILSCVARGSLPRSVGKKGKAHQWALMDVEPYCRDVEARDRLREIVTRKAELCTKQESPPVGREWDGSRHAKGQRKRPN